MRSQPRRGKEGREGLRAKTRLGRSREERPTNLNRIRRKPRPAYVTAPCPTQQPEIRVNSGCSETIVIRRSGNQGRIVDPVPFRLVVWL
jgi:hypothetical protein